MLSGSGVERALLRGGKEKGGGCLWPRRRGVGEQVRLKRGREGGQWECETNLMRMITVSLK